MERSPSDPHTGKREVKLEVRWRSDVDCLKDTLSITAIHDYERRRVVECDRAVDFRLLLECRTDVRRALCEVCKLVHIIVEFSSLPHLSDAGGRRHAQRASRSRSPLVPDSGHFRTISDGHKIPVQVRVRIGCPKWNRTSSRRVRVRKFRGLTGPMPIPTLGHHSQPIRTALSKKRSHPTLSG